jgi:hypothetical protein
MMNWDLKQHIQLQEPGMAASGVWLLSLINTKHQGNTWHAICLHSGILSVFLTILNHPAELSAGVPAADDACGW